MLKVEEIIKYTKPLRLLYVEDDAAAAESARFLLEEFFEEIIISRDGKEGLESFEKNDVDLIITDINMPRMDGLEMIAKIREVDNAIPIVVLSAHMQSEYFIKSIKLNVKGYLLKPICVTSLLEILETIITSRKLKAEIEKNRRMKENHHAYLQRVIDNVYDPIMVIREDYSIELMNESLKASFSASHIADINSPKCYEISHHRSTPCDGVELLCPLKDVLEHKKSIKVVHEHYVNANDKKYIELAATPFFDDNENCVGIIESSRDVTSHIRSQQELRVEKEALHHKAHHDALTGLANRVLFNDRLEEALLRAKHTDTKVALFFMDLDKFKQVNDSFGHKYGDYVLQVTSQRISDAIRKEDFIARIGGDEFSVIMRDLDRVEEAVSLAEKIIKYIEEPMEYEGETISISGSIGISVYPDSELDAESLLKLADVCMYKAKVSKKRIFLNQEKGK